VHTGGGRRRGKPRSRILYWFRTPPGVRVGRSALDEDAIRLIEEHNPDVEFDWTRILKGQGEPETRPPAQQERRGRQRPPRDFAPRASVPPAVPIIAAPPDPDDLTAIAAAEEVESIPEVLANAIPFEAPTEETPHATEPPSSAAEARLGAEGLSRLRARHAEVLARISEATPDPARRDELKAQAERLNPDTWVTDSEVTAGLESYETVFESLRTAVGRRKRRRSRKPGEDQASSPAVPDEPDDETTDPEID
jgi:hypothetical protein